MQIFRERKIAPYYTTLALTRDLVPLAHTSFYAFALVFVAQTRPYCIGPIQVCTNRSKYGQWSTVQSMFYLADLRQSTKCGEFDVLLVLWFGEHAQRVSSASTGPGYPTRSRNHQRTIHSKRSIRSSKEHIVQPWSDRMMSICRNDFPQTWSQPTHTLSAVSSAAYCVSLTADLMLSPVSFAAAFRSLPVSLWYKWRFKRLKSGSGTAADSSSPWDTQSPWVDALRSRWDGMSEWDAMSRSLGSAAMNRFG